jgi:hypothetical protein
MVIRSIQTAGAQRVIENIIMVPGGGLEPPRPVKVCGF